MKKNKKIVFISIGILLIALGFIIPIVISEMQGSTMTPTKFESINLSEQDFNQILINVYEDGYYYYFDINFTSIRPGINDNEGKYVYYTQDAPYIMSKEFIMNEQELEQVIQREMTNLRDSEIAYLRQIQPTEKTQVTYFNDKIGKKWDCKTGNFVDKAK